MFSVTHNDRWAGRGGPTAWPTRSTPDMNQDFHLWGRLKALVYSAHVDNEKALHLITVRLSATTPTSLN